MEVCRDGLRRHPGYLSARITLGRALVELGQSAEAEKEFEYVLRTAPDNVPALRGLAEIHEKLGNLHRALNFYRRALELARYDPDLDETVRAIAEELDGPPGHAGQEGLSFEQAREELLEAPSRVPFVPPKPRVDFGQVLQSLGYDPEAPAPPIVEAWLSEPPLASAPAVEPPLALHERSTDQERGTDLLAQLERDLRHLEPRPPASPAEEASPSEEGGSSGHFSDTDQIVVGELERWLAGIAVRRRAMNRGGGASADHVHA